MTLTLELPADVEQELQALAAQRGVRAEATALQLVAEGLRQEARRAQREAALSGYGRFAAPGFTVEALLQERREEARREMEQEAEMEAGR